MEFRTKNYSGENRMCSGDEHACMKQTFLQATSEHTTD